MHKKLHYLVVAGLIAITASGSLQLNAVVKNQEVTAVWEDAGDAANGADPQDDASANDAINTDNPDGDGTEDTDNPTQEGEGTATTTPSGTDADATDEIKAVWEDSDTYNDANGTTDNNGGPTITASKTKFLINKGDNFDLLSSLGLKVVDATDGDITSTVPKVDIPTTSTGSINKVLKVTNKKGITSELPIQINIIDVPKSITVKSESELENYSWGNEIGASNALTINVSDLADGKVTLTVSDKVNTLDYQVAVNVKGSDSNDADNDNDNNDNDANNDNANDTDNTDTDVDNDTDADTDTDNDNDASNDNENNNDSDSTNDNATGDNPSGTTDNNGGDNASTGDRTGDDNQTVVNEDGSDDGTTSLDNTKTGAVAVGQIGVGLTGLLAMAIKRFRK